MNMDKTITKNTLAKAIFYEMGIPVSIAQDIVDSVFDNISKHTAQDGTVKIPNFGSFYVKEKQKRIGRDLNTLKEVLIDARKVVSFYPSNQLKRLVND